MKILVKLLGIGYKSNRFGINEAGFIGRTPGTMKPFFDGNVFLKQKSIASSDLIRYEVISYQLNQLSDLVSFNFAKFFLLTN